MRESTVHSNRHGRNTYCTLCLEKITNKNRSKEHLFPNAIGGRRKIPDFICRSCNKYSGSQWDQSLTDQLNIFSVFFGISRERGSPPPETVETTTGEKLLFHSNGGFSPTKPTYTENKTEQGTQIQIKARTHREARDMLSGLKRKYPNIEPEELLKTAKKNFHYVKDRIRFQPQFGGEDSSRSIIKTVVAFAHNIGLEPKYYKSVIAYLRSESVPPPDFNYYYGRDLLIERPKGIPLHCVSLSGDPKTGLLLAYIEYFGIFRIVVRLSTQYSDTAINRSYAINPKTGCVLDVVADLNFSNKDISEIMTNKETLAGLTEQVIADIIQPRLVEVFNTERDKVINEAALFAIENCGAKEGDILTKDHINTISSLIAERVIPFFMNSLNLRRETEKMSSN